MLFRSLEERTATLNATARRTKVMILAGTALALLLAVLAAFQVSRDLAARQRVEQVLQQSEERFQALADGVKDYAIFWLDPEGRVASWNAGAERLKGYRADEIIGQPLSRFYTPEDVAAGKPEHELRTATAEGRVEDEAWRCGAMDRASGPTWSSPRSGARGARCSASARSRAT